MTDPTTPLVFSLDQNYPNPFNPTTTIAFSIAKKGPVKMQLFDIDGRLVKTLVDEEMAPGQYKVVWNGENRSGSTVASGVYFVRLRAASFESTKKMLLIR